MPGSDYALLKTMDGIDCKKDTLCTYTLMCYSCDAGLGYFLEQGFCYKDECRKYQRYSSTSATFNSAFCSCIDGYYPSGLTCSKCHYSC